MLLPMGTLSLKTCGRSYSIVLVVAGGGFDLVFLVVVRRITQHTSQSSQLRIDAHLRTSKKLVQFFEGVLRTNENPSKKISPIIPCACAGGAPHVVAGARDLRIYGYHGGYLCKDSFALARRLTFPPSSFIVHRRRILATQTVVERTECKPVGTHDDDSVRGLDD